MRRSRSRAAKCHWQTLLFRSRRTLAALRRCCPMTVENLHRSLTSHDTLTVDSENVNVYGRRRKIIAVLISCGREKEGAKRKFLKNLVTWSGQGVVAMFGEGSHRKNNTSGQRMRRWPRTSIGGQHSDMDWITSEDTIEYSNLACGED